MFNSSFVLRMSPIREGDLVYTIFNRKELFQIWVVVYLPMERPVINVIQVYI